MSTDAAEDIKENTEDALILAASLAIAACSKHAAMSREEAIVFVSNLFPASVAPTRLITIASHTDPVDATCLGAIYEKHLADRQSENRKRRGSFYTPPTLADRICAKARISQETKSVLDPSCGAGSILIAALSYARPEAVHGADIDHVAVWLARVSLALLSGSDPDGWKRRIVCGDSLRASAFSSDEKFEAVVGNPPWVSYAGRAAAPLSDWKRSDYRRRFRSFSGFPTTHGMFAELAASLLAPGGRMSLLVPSSIADLAGYGHARASVEVYAAVDDPIEEIDPNTFDSVVQPAVILSAIQRSGAPEPVGSVKWNVFVPGEPRPTLPTSLLKRLAEMPKFPDGTFGEGGFQTAKDIAKTHLRKAGGGDIPSIPMREGSDVVAFFAENPKISLIHDIEALRAAGCSVKDREFYQRVSVIIRQTARYPIASRNFGGYAFRNSVLAGYSAEPDVLCALLNSRVLRALHLSSQRDGRQAVFPQLKVSHLRDLPLAPTEKYSFEIIQHARSAMQAQRDLVSAVLAYGNAPKSAFNQKDGSIEPSASFLKTLKSKQEKEAFDWSLSLARGCLERFHTAYALCDYYVARSYDLTSEEEMAIDSVLSFKTKR
jgi:hypothetical protein